MKVLISPKQAFKRVKRDFSQKDYELKARGLMDRVIRFLDFLRTNRLPVHTSSEIDAFEALQLVDINDPFQFYMALRSSIVTKHNQIGLFNQLYMHFWGTGPKIPKPSDDGSEEETEQESPQVKKKLSDEPSDAKSKKGGCKDGPTYEEIPSFTFSMIETLKEKDFESISQSEMAVLDEVFKNLRISFRERRGRRFKPVRNGKYLDIRRSIRQSTQQGGEIIHILKRDKKPRQSKIVVLADVSGSMDTYSMFLIKFIYELQKYLRDTETFVFGTQLRRITDILSYRSVRTALNMVSQRVLFWSGGTDIGGCFEQFNEKYGGKYLSRNRILVILSDGWDKGKIETLRRQMITFKRGFKKIIWLNPHLKYDRYQPLCLGMATALPYADHFLPCHNIATLQHFLEVVKKI